MNYIIISSDFLVKFISHQFNGIAPAETSIEGCAVSLHFQFSPGHYLARVQILDPKAMFQMGLREKFALIASLIQFALHLVQILDLAIGKSPQHDNRASSMLYGWCDTEVAALSPTL